MDETGRMARLGVENMICGASHRQRREFKKQKRLQDVHM